MKGVILLLLVIFSVNSADARTNCGGWWFTYSDDEQACKRCQNAFGELRNNCSGSIRGHEGKNTAIVIKLDTVVSGQFTEPKRIFKMRYAYCNAAGGWHDDGCPDDGFDGDSKFVEIEETRIVDKPEQCRFNLQQFHDISPQNIIVQDLKDKICFVKFSRNEARNYAEDFPLSDSDPFATVVCAFDVTGGTDAKRDKLSQWTSIGCVPFNMVDGPPPFSKGFIPASYFVVPKINLLTDLKPDSTFKEPIAMANFIVGSDIIDRITFDIELEKNITKVCQKYKGQGPDYCAEITSTFPYRIDISKNNLPLGNYPRPALEQRKSNLSFFPCYHTYTNFKNSVYQAIFPFSITANIGDKIGEVNGKDLYLGLNYLPSTSPDKIGDIQETKCDLCINAAKTENWDGNIYSEGYSLSDGSLISECSLNNNILINKIKIVKQSGGMEINYPFDNSDEESKMCKPTQKPAPLRVNMFDIDEQKQSKQCDKTQNPINYSYNSSSGFLDKYLVSIKPIIPKLKNNGEAEYYTAIQTPADASKHCNGYLQDPDGMVFVMPSGLRDKNDCKYDPDSKQEGLFTLCAEKSDTDKMYDAICPGLYIGPEEGQVSPDKICMMSAMDWDFFTGRYNSKTFRSLNGNNEIVPRMSCTYLPACKSLGTNTIPNVGNAIWDMTANFNEQTKGKCEFNYDDAETTPQGNYSYRYYIKSYHISDDVEPNIRNTLETTFDKIKSEFEKNNPPYISEEMIGENSELKKFYDKQIEQGKNIFVCKRIEPQAKCIGGIYGNLTINTSCVNTKEFGTPLRCKLDE